MLTKDLIMQTLGKYQEQIADDLLQQMDGPQPLNPSTINSKLTILFLGNFEAEFSSENYYKKTLEKMGHTVIAMQEGKTSKEELLSKSCDLFFWVHTHGWITAGILDVLATFRNSGIISFGYHLDLYMGLDRWKEYENSEYFQVDHFFTVDKLMADWMNEKGKAKGHYLPAGVYEGECVLGTPNREKYPHDIIFTGAKGYHSEWPYRTKLIDWLQQTYGNRFAQYGNGGKEVIRGMELNNLYASAKIVIGDTLCKDFSYPWYFSDRLFEVPGRGGFMIFPIITGLNSFYNVGMPNQELVTYNFNFLQEELKIKIDHFLQADEEREQIRLAGFQRTIREHTYTQRMKTILETLAPLRGFKYPALSANVPDPHNTQPHYVSQVPQPKQQAPGNVIRFND